MYLDPGTVVDTASTKSFPEDERLITGDGSWCSRSGGGMDVSGKKGLA